MFGIHRTGCGWSISLCRWWWWGWQDIAGRPHLPFFFFVSVRCNTCTNTVCPPVFLNIEGSCVLYCREWKMPFTLWYGRSGCTGSISSARKKRLRAVSSLKSVLWCERGKCMQPRAHQLCVSLCVCVSLVGIVERRGAVRTGASWILKANLLVSTWAVVKL